MPTYIDLTNLSPATITALSSTAPTITQVQITTSGYVVKDDTAVSTSGGYIKITGTNFTAGTQVVIGSATATSVTFVSSTVLNVQVPAQAAGTYIIYVTVSNGGVAILVNGLTYSGDPTWVTGSTLTGGQVDSAISIQFSATGDAPVTYALQAGSTLPPGLSLSSGGLLSGTVTGITSETTYNFTVEAIDAQAQESPRAFSITITASDQYFDYVTTLLSASNPASTFVTDASTNNFAVTVFGDTRPNNFGPYTSGYYSGYFDGNDSLSIANSSNFDIVSDFTIECWSYASSVVSGESPMFGKRASNLTYSNIVFGLNVSGGVNKLFLIGTTVSGSWNIAFTNGSITLPTGQWNHIAVVRSGTTLKTYINGVGDSTWTGVSGAFFTNTDAMTIGTSTTNGTGGYYTGFISNFRFVNGTAVYTSNFTPSTTPLTAIANTQLLTCQSNRFIDNSTNNFTVTRAGDTSISGFDPFSPNSNYSTYGSGYFDGTGDYLSLTSNAAFAAPADFTVEFWAYTSSLASNPVFYLINATNGLIVYVTGSKVVIRSYGVADLLTSNINMPLNQWVHIAASRSGTTMSLWINGSRTDGGTVTNSTSFAQGELRIGNNETVAQGVTGYISNVRFVKGTAVYDPTQTTITVPTSPLTAVANTQLLTLQNNQPNNNSMFLDSSTNNFLITRNGNTTQGSFSPYGGGWSNYFDGNGDYLSYTQSGSTFPAPLSFLNGTTGTGTLECWVYVNSSSQGLNVYDFPPIIAVGDTYFSFGVTTTNKLRFYWWTGSTNNLDSTGTVSFNTWTHVAFVRNGATVTLYVNGTSSGSISYTGWSWASTANGSVLFIGLTSPSSSSRFFNGYISNLRVVNGTAVYTTAFTTPTAPLTPIANTSLLTCADNRFIDDSANNFTITRNGDVSVQRFNPFNPVLTTPTSYSGYFDGSGDYLSLLSNSAFAFGTGDFTIEMWAYFTSVANFPTLTDSRASTSSTAGFNLGLSSAKVQLYTTSQLLIGATTLTANNWNHIAVTRSGTTLRIFLNGVQDASATNSTNWSDTTLRIGATPDTVNFMTGYISNVRLVKGTAVYTSNFTPSTTPLTAIANTSLLTCQNATFIDNSTNNFTITAFGNSQPIQFNPFGWTSTTGSSAAYSATNYGGSMYFDGTGDFLSASGSISLAGQFTAQCWFYNTSSSGAQQTLFVFNSVSGNGYGSLRADCDQGNVQFNFSVNLSTNGTGWTSTISTNSIYIKNQWNHFAVTRDSNNLVRVFLNGVLINSATVSGALYSASTTHAIGCNNLPGTATNPFNGYISNLQLVNGTSLYTSNFAPPVAPVSFNANAVLQVNGTGAAIYDSSMIATYETVGNASSTTVIKKYGNSSMSFDGSSSYLRGLDSPIIEPGAANLTWEMWIKTTSSTPYATLYSRTPASFASGMWSLMINYASASAGDVALFVANYSTSTYLLLTTGVNVRDDAWHHIAVVRNGSAWTLYVDGTSRATGTWSGTIADIAGAPLVGYDQFYGRSFGGYVDDLRITNGIARYTSNFTPTTTPFIQY